MAEPTPEMMIEHLDGQVQTLMRENARLRAALKKIEGDALVAETRNDAQAIARYAHSVLTD